MVFIEDSYTANTMTVLAQCSMKGFEDKFLLIILYVSVMN